MNYKIELSGSVIVMDAENETEARERAEKAIRAKWLEKERVFISGWLGRLELEER